MNKKLTEWELLDLLGRKLTRLAELSESDTSINRRLLNLAIISHEAIEAKNLCNVLKSSIAQKERK
jgi:hypothetical protein